MSLFDPAAPGSLRRDNRPRAHRNQHAIRCAQRPGDGNLTIFGHGHMCKRQRRRDSGGILRRHHTRQTDMRDTAPQISKAHPDSGCRLRQRR